MLKLTPQPVKYRGVISGLRISSVDGTAFIDGANSSVTDLADGNHQISIFDSTGKELRGVLKAAGDGEDLGDEKITAEDDRTFASDTGWWSKITVDIWSIGSGVASYNGSNGYLHRLNLLSTNALYKHTGTFVITKGTNRLHDVPVYATISSSATRTDYFTAFDAHHSYYCGATSTGSVDDLSIKQVTAPSTSGCTIVSTKGGVTYNWSLKTTGFAYNATSYYCLIRKAR